MPRLRRSASLVLAVLLAAAAGSSSPVDAGEPEFSFDFGRTAECRDVTPADFATAHPDERIVEFTLRLSAHLTAGAIEEVDALRVEISDCDARLRVFDFAPRTRLESQYADAIETTKTVESHKSFTASLGGEIPCLSGGVANVTPSLGGELGDKEIVTEKVKRVAPKQAVVASGTMNEEHGVFFTLRTSPLMSLEGVHELSVQFIVPVTWRGDAVQVACQATGRQKVLWMTQQRTLGRKATAAALYLEGDAGARRAAARYVRR